MAKTAQSKQGPASKAAKAHPTPTEEATTPADTPLTKANPSPDASVDTLALHSERLVETLAANAGALALAKIGDDDRAALTDGAAKLRASEGIWQQAQAAETPGTVAEARTKLTTGRRDLHGALRVFVKNKETQRLVDGVGDVEDDDDLASDVAVLLPLARKHAADFEGTELTPERVEGVGKLLAAFHAARVGVRSTAGGTTTAQVLSEAALTALRARNDAFWALSALNRDVSARARYRFRDDPKRRALFGAYNTDRVGRPRRATVGEPTDEATGEVTEAGVEPTPVVKKPVG